MTEGLLYGASAIVAKSGQSQICNRLMISANSIAHVKMARGIMGFKNIVTKIEIVYGH